VGVAAKKRCQIFSQLALKKITAEKYHGGTDGFLQWWLYTRRHLRGDLMGQGIFIKTSSQNSHQFQHGFSQPLFFSELVG
jgi:hypothetical protein